MTYRFWFSVVGIGILFVLPVRADEVESVPRVVAGDIKNPDGTPAVGVKIQVYTINDRRGNMPTHEPNGKAIPTEKFESEGQTDQSGVFRMELTTPAKGAFLRMTSPGGPAVSKGFHFFPLPPGYPAIWSRMTIKLSAYKTAQYQVVDTDGRPIAGVIVHRMTGGFQNLGPILFRTAPTNALRIGETTEKGVVDDFAERDNSQFVWAEKEGYLTQCICIGPQNQRESQFGDGLTTIDFRPVEQDDVFKIVMRPSSRVEGRVFEPATGMPVSGASVIVEVQLGGHRETWTKGSVFPYLVQTTSGQDGRFSVPGFPATELKIFVWADGRFASRELVNTASTQPNSIGDLPTDEGTIISGRVWDVDAQIPAAVENGRVECRSFGGSSFRGNIQDDGRFEIRVPKLFVAPVYLLPHPLWSEHSSSKSHSSPTTPARIDVQRRPPPLTDDEIPGELANFPQSYQLQVTEVARRVNRPFPRSREAYFQCVRLPGFLVPEWMAASSMGHMRTIGSVTPTSPNGAVFVVDKKGRYRIGISTHGQLKIGEILMSAYPNMGYNRILWNSNTGHRDPVLADFVIREGVPIEELVPGINAAFDQEPRIPAHLSLRNQMFLTGVVKNRPDPDRLASQKKIRLIPEGYEGPTETLNFGGSWRNLVDQVIEHQLGIEWKMECEDTPEQVFAVVEVPRLANQTGATTQEERQAAHQARMDLQKQLREIAPAAFQECLGVELEIKEIPLPVVTIE